MISKSILSLCATAGAVVALCAGIQKSQGQINAVLNSNVEGFFGSNSDAYQQSEGPLVPPWTAVGFPLPHGPLGLPNIPALYAGYPNPSTPLTQNIDFASVNGHAPSSPFTDGVTSANYHIYGGYLGTGLYTSDAYAMLGNNTTNLMYLSQPSTATGYAYEEAQFAIDYSVNPTTGLLAGSAGPRPYFVAGQFLPGGSAEFGANVNYWWIPMTVNTGSGVVTYGTPLSLGSLQYDYYLVNVTGSFAQMVPDTYGSNYLNGVAPGSTGILELTGSMYLIGDPVSISVEAPEPGAMALLALGGLGGLVSRRRKLTA